MKKQTAVEWLMNEIYRMDRKIGIGDLIKQAKEMEKEQMKSMYVEGSFAKMRHFDGLEYIGAEQYYNETFKCE